MRLVFEILTPIESKDTQIVIPLTKKITCKQIVDAWKPLTSLLNLSAAEVVEESLKEKKTC